MADDFDRVKLNPISTNQLSSLIIGEKGLPQNIGQAGDPELEYLTEGNVPISQAEMKTRQIRKKFGDQKVVVVDDFYSNPEMVRDISLNSYASKYDNVEYPGFRNTLYTNLEFQLKFFTKKIKNFYF